MTRPPRTIRLLGPLLESQPDLAFAQDRLFLKPVRNVLRFVFFQEYPKLGTFHAFWTVQLLCCPADLYELGGEIWTGSHLPGSQEKPTFFELAEDRQSEILCRGIEEEALPMLRSFDQAEKAARHFLEVEGPNTDDPQHRFWFQCILGRFDVASALQADHRASWLREAATPWYEDKEWNDRLEAVCRLLERGLERQVATLLHEWEAITAKNFKIEHLWEPTPFPFETA